MCANLKIIIQVINFFYFGLFLSQHKNIIFQYTIDIIFSHTRYGDPNKIYLFLDFQSMTIRK